MYKVASPLEYLVITDVGIRDVKLAKKAWVLPGQSCTVFDISPVNYTFEVQAMSAEKLLFVLPVYFSYLDQKTQMKAANQAKIDVAEAKMKGEIGAKLLEGKTLQNEAEIDVETRIISTQRQGEGKKEEIKVKTDVSIYENQKEADVAGANAELGQRKWGGLGRLKMVEVESAKAVAIREAELQREVERMNALTRTEKLRAELLSKAGVEYETRKVQEANWEFYKNQKAA
uniref:Flotillin-like n=1 Tax=Nelumbo nucifera TaxID=4432 RepID=A0A822Y3Q5_NELNU|nr:TPA_asm: hypothetical protein HUJ06_028370 [Nelumbo nucifera]